MSSVAITGASGFIGSALSRALAARGVAVRPLVRPGKSAPGGVAWDPRAGTIDAAGLEGVDAVVHLAGENIAAGRWTAAQKAEIRQSRIAPTELLARTLAGLTKKPAVWVSASAIGFYGDRGDEPIDERAGPGNDFLSELAMAWEGATAPAQVAGIRVVHARFGVLLDPAGGALAKMLLPFKLGLGGRLGSGTQVMSWVAREDAIAALVFLLEKPGAQGPYNVTAPRPVTNAEFTAALGHAVSRPTIFPLPAPLARLALGEMADVALLKGARVLPARLLESGFRFTYPEVGPFLAKVLA
jgi:uncharacterized protein (TIGR01777 family)